MFDALTTMLIRDCGGVPHNPHSRVMVMDGIKQGDFSPDKLRVQFEDNGAIAYVSPTEVEPNAKV